MKILGFNIQISRSPGVSSAAPVPATRLSSPALDWLRGEEQSVAPQLSNAYEQVVWVYRAVNLLAEQVASIPFLFSRGERGCEELITSGPLHDFYSRPHPRLNRFEYWELRVIWLMLRGECFRVPVYEDEHGREGLAGELGARKRLKRVLMLDPDRVDHIIEDHELAGWRYRGSGPTGAAPAQVFLPEEVWHEKLPNPFNFWRGLAPLRVATESARAEFAAGLFMRGIIENNADTGVIVRTDKWLEEEQRQEILAMLKNRKRHAGRADKPAFVCGVTEIVKPELSSSDMQFLENRKFTRSEICAAFGVPEELVTTTEYAKYDVMEGARYNFVENRVIPLCGRIEAEEQQTVHALDPNASGWFDLESIPLMQKARRERLAAARAGFDMGVPINEQKRTIYITCFDHRSHVSGRESVTYDKLKHHQ